MEQTQRGTTVQMLQNQIAELKANIQSCAERLSRLPEGGLRKQFEADQAELRGRLAAKEVELVAALQGTGGVQTPALKKEKLLKEIDHLQANLQSCEDRMSALPEGEARRFYEKDRADLAERLAQRRKDLSALP